MQKNTLILILALISTVSCQTQEDKPDLSFTQDFISFLTYFQQNINLEKNSNYLNIDGKKMNKTDFLTALQEGKQLPIKTSSKETTYRLVAMPKGVDEGIVSSLSTYAKLAMRLHLMVGKTFPDYNLMDISGKPHSFQNNIGKTTVFKFWFIGCKACVEEFPELNELVSEFAGKENISFIAISDDSRQDLKKFFNKQNFDYSVVSDPQKEIGTYLDIHVYPTHIVVDSKGKIIAAFNDAHNLKKFLAKLSI